MTRYDALLAFFMQLCRDMSKRWGKTLEETAMLFKNYHIFERVDVSFEEYNSSGIENTYNDIERYITMQGGTI